ncbi:tyrosine-type recombinase/integrase [Pelagibius sp. CAU 1746]|uniref:tyrosine-type recombinase/integrase n=1 Tax=Pelagibius sp. CAU 1746 TaxID=3140370 RepID=UPI00325B47B5
MSSSSDATISDAAKLWLKRCKAYGLERATLRSYTGHFKHHIEPKIGGLLLKDLVRADVEDFLDDMLDTSSKAMTKKVLASLRSILTHAQSRGWIEHNFARDVKLPRGRRHEEEKVIPTKGEIKLLLTKAPEKHKPIIVTAILTGMRSSELRGLTWDNVDLKKGVIYIRQRADRWNEMGPPKSRAGRRDIPIGSMVRETLTEWKKVCPPGPANLVFPNGKGNPETHANIYNRVFKPLMVKCEIVDGEGKPRFSIHGLRHAAASLFIEQGWSPKKIQTILGHSSINMTFDVYGHLFHDAEADVALMEKVEKDLMAA